MRCKLTARPAIGGNVARVLCRHIRLCHFAAVVALSLSCDTWTVADIHLMLPRTSAAAPSHVHRFSSCTLEYKKRQHLLFSWSSGRGVAHKFDSSECVAFAEQSQLVCWGPHELPKRCMSWRGSACRKIGRNRSRTYEVAFPSTSRPSPQCPQPARLPTPMSDLKYGMFGWQDEASTRLRTL